MKLRASHILVSDRDKAIEILKLVKSGGSFEQAAAKYSLCPSGKQGGDLGWFEKGMMVPSFEDACLQLKVNELTEVPVKTQFGWHVIKLTGKQ